MNATQKSQDKKDPRGVAASRSQSGGTAGQGQHGVTKSRVKAAEKGSEGDRTPALSRKVSLASGREPTFYIGGGNGVPLVEGPLTELGWKRITDKQNENFKFKWVECKNTINYNAFKEGEQMVNHIPNCNLLTNKMGLLTSLQAYERLNSGPKRRETKLKLYDFMPETYRLDDPKERETFLETHQENDIWICKPTGMNQGKGIYLVRDLDEFRTTLQERDEKQKNTRRVHRANMGRVIQRYLSRPLLLDGRKFDIRAYMLIGSTVPYLVLYHKGYVRLSLIEYDVKVDDLTAHLTNQFIQKRDPTYKEEKESTAWSMDKFNDYINDHVAPLKGLEQDWVYNTLTTKMKQIMLYCFHAVKNRLHCKIGYSDLYGLDFMVDEDMKVYLIEVNVNPSLATNCEALKEVIPGVVKETVYLTLECFEKSRKGQPLMPLHSLKQFDILHNGCTKSPKSAPAASSRSAGDARQPGGSGGSGPPAPRGSSHSPVRRQKSPGKDAQPLRTSGRSSQGLVSDSTRGSAGRAVGGTSSGSGKSGMTPKSTLQPLTTHHVLLSPAPLKPIKERKEPVPAENQRAGSGGATTKESTTEVNAQTTTVITELGEEVRRSSGGQRKGSGGKGQGKQEDLPPLGSLPKPKVERMILPKLPQPRTRTAPRATRQKTRSPDRGN